MGSTGWGALARPVLRPGLHVVRRDDAHLQVGLDPPDRLVLRDLPGLHDALTGHQRTPRTEVRQVLDQLVEGGWIVDAGSVGRAAQEEAARRPPLALVADPLLTDALTRVCATAGLRLDRAAETRLVATVGEPRRGLSDQLVRDDAAHLWLAVLPRTVRIGPFVEPGRTACLRCVDAHLGDGDARRATVLHQLEELPAAPYGGWDPLLVQLAAAWAVRDVVRRLDGRPPALRSASVTVSVELEVTRRDWLRHPHCGCAWG
jgi:hypothetical protein